jgi:hypothetical protein
MLLLLTYLNSVSETAAACCLLDLSKPVPVVASSSEWAPDLEQRHHEPDARTARCLRSRSNARWGRAFPRAGGARSRGPANRRRGQGHHRPSPEVTTVI